jgi:Flp pilus assembly protein TadG
MMGFRKIRRNEDGSAAIEMAIAVPVLITMIYGLFRFGLLYEANAGMSHALGEGARYATLYPTPADATIKTRMENALFGKGYGNFVVSDPASDATSKTLTITYTTPLNFLFFSVPNVTLTRTKKVYTPAAGA